MNIEFPDAYEWNLDMLIAHVIVQGITPPLRAARPAHLEDEEWNTILDTIKDGFKEYRDNFYTEKYDADKFNRARDLLVEWFSALWW